jgi:hypothetical protein
MLAQTFRDFSFRLYVPRVCKRTGERYQVPEVVAAYEKELSVCHIDRDYGPATKLLAPLAEIEAQQGAGPACIVTIDDDVLLEPHAIEELVAAAARYPGEAIGFMGVSGGRFIHAETLSEMQSPHATVSVLGGYRGVLYPLEILDASLIDDYESIAERCDGFVDDDHLFAWNLARRNITRRVIATGYPGPRGLLNIQVMDLADSITYGPDGGAAVERSHSSLSEYYLSNGWPFPT